MAKYFVVDYQRTAETAKVQQFTSWTHAASALREHERVADGDTEVVLLVADSESDLRRTHSRYFVKRRDMLGEPNDVQRWTRH